MFSVVCTHACYTYFAIYCDTWHHFPLVVVEASVLPLRFLVVGDLLD